MQVVLVHGSVETPDEPPYREALARAALVGFACLDGGALDAAEEAVAFMERDPLFNAGVGSVLNLAGEAEMDAAIVDGRTGAFGAVGAIQGVATPVRVARKVLAETPHVFLAGGGATTFARSMGFPEEECRTEEQQAAWREASRLLAREGEGALREFSAFTGLRVEPAAGHDTVGCVVRGADGHLVAASSTGGSFLKLPGRIGDTPCLGGGIYASPHAAVVCTGVGEICVELLLAKEVEHRVRQGASPEDAASEAIALVNRKRRASVGVLVVDAHGRFGAAHNSPSFPVGLVVEGEAVALTPAVVR